MQPRPPYTVLVLVDGGLTAKEMADHYGVVLADCVVWRPDSPNGGNWRPLPTDTCLYDPGRAQA